MPTVRASRPIWRLVSAAAMFAALAWTKPGRAQFQDPPVFQDSGIYIPPKAVFFPPSPPPLDHPITHIAAPAPQRLAAPPELALYVSEPFYAPLSTWLVERTLTPKLRERLDAYRTRKLALLRELRATLAQTRTVEAAARHDALAKLAQQQAAALTSLEQEAAKLRDDLTTGTYDWRSLRQWSLGDKALRGDSPMEIASVMRAYAYYQSNLSPAQRRLLREITLEIAMAAEDEKAARAAQPYLFFSPELARITLPDDLPADLAAKVADYQTKKSAVKKELFDTIYKQDSASFPLFRQNAMRTLAERQAGRIAELDRIAESIRVGLAQLPTGVGPPAERSPLPPVLTERIASLLATRTTLQKEATAKIEAIRERNAGAPLLISYSFETDGLKFIVLPRRGARSSSGNYKEQIQAIREELATISEDFGRRYAELVNETDAVREETKKFLGKTDPREIENVIGAATRVAALHETEEAYRDYRTAVFEPGLSPEQRRLLLDGAVERLDLPLPRGEMQPTFRAASW